MSNNFATLFTNTSKSVKLLRLQVRCKEFVHKSLNFYKNLSSDELPKTKSSSEPSREFVMLHFKKDVAFSQPSTFAWLCPKKVYLNRYLKAAVLRWAAKNYSQVCVPWFQQMRTPSPSCVLQRNQTQADFLVSIQPFCWTETTMSLLCVLALWHGLALENDQQF